MGALVAAVVSCGPPPSGALSSRVSADSALASSFTTEDGWSLSFTHVVVAVSGVTVSGEGTAGFTTSLAKPKVVDLIAAPQVELLTNAMATPRTYDTLSVVVSRGTNDEIVNVPADVMTRMGTRPFYIEATATKQSTTRQLQLAVTNAMTFSGCMPSVKLDASGTAVADFKVHAQRLFTDDTGKLRFDAWAAADASPVDMLVVNNEAAAVMTSSLPAAQYGGTTGSLLTVFEKRALTMVGLSDSGTCTGK